MLYYIRYVHNGYLVRIPAENIPWLACSLKYTDANHDGYSYYPLHSYDASNTSLIVFGVGEANRIYTSLIV